LWHQRTGDPACGNLRTDHQLTTDLIPTDEHCPARLAILFKAGRFERPEA
jgi:hypothetical protein